MAHIDIKCPLGIKEDIKYLCADEIADVVSRLFECKKSDISVVIKEVPKYEWKNEVYEKQIYPNSKFLYKQPGYNYTIEFEYYNPSNYRNNYVPRALSKILDKTYDEIEEELSALTDELNMDSYCNPVVFEAYMEKHGIYKFAELTNTLVRELSLNHGTYCLYCYNSIGEFFLIPVINNVMYERNSNCMELNVITIYQLENLK